MKKHSEIIKSIIFKILYAVLGLLIVFIVMLSAFPELSLNTFGVRAYVAKYDTMEPKISPYDLVVINHIDVSNLEIGDLVTFNTDVDYNGSSEMVTYYVAQLSNENGVLRVHPEGTSANVSTQILEKNIIGGYSFSIPVLGRIIEFVSSPFGIAAILVNIGVITAIVILFKDNKKESKKEDVS